MKFGEIKSELALFKEQIELIAGDQIQGIKVARILFIKLESLMSKLAYAAEKIGDLHRKVFGGKPSAPERPDDPERSDVEKGCQEGCCKS